jgi:transcriptional regulator
MINSVAVLKLRRKGWSITNIASMIGVDRQSVLKCLKELGEK